MHNLWLMAKYEYGRMARRRSFIFATLGIPLLIVAVMAVSILVSSGGETQPLGYVDQAGLLTTGIETEQDTQLQRFSDPAAAQAALENETIGAYYVIPAGYPQTTRTLRLTYRDSEPDGDLVDEFEALVRQGLARSLPPEVQQTVLEAPDFVARTPDGSRSLGAGNFMSILLPFASAFFFFFAVMTASGYLLQVVVDEKENRTMEIMITSLTPEQLIGGKALGLLGVSLTQLSIWAATIVGGIAVGAQFFAPLGNVQIPWTHLLVMLLFFLPAFALIAGIMTAIGGAMADVRQSQQVAGLLNLLFVAPFFFIALIFTNPNSLLLQILTFFPTTSFLTVTLRWGLSTVPLWQAVTSWIILVTTAVFSIWAAARIFRAGMLRYGQRLSLQNWLAALGLQR